MRTQIGLVLVLMLYVVPMEGCQTGKRLDLLRDGVPTAVLLGGVSDPVFHRLAMRVYQHPERGGETLGLPEGSHAFQEDLGMLPDNMKGQISWIWVFDNWKVRLCRLERHVPVHIGGKG